MTKTNIEENGAPPNDLEKLREDALDAVQDDPLAPKTAEAVMRLSTVWILTEKGEEADEKAIDMWEIRALDRLSTPFATSMFNALFRGKPFPTVEEARRECVSVLERASDAEFTKRRVLAIAREWMGSGDVSDFLKSIDDLLDYRNPLEGTLGASYFLALSSAATALFSDEERKLLIRVAVDAALAS